MGVSRHNSFSPCYDSLIIRHFRFRYEVSALLDKRQESSYSGRFLTAHEAEVICREASVCSNAALRCRKECVKWLRGQGSSPKSKLDHDESQIPPPARGSIPFHKTRID